MASPDRQCRVRGHLPSTKPGTMWRSPRHQKHRCLTMTIPTWRKSVTCAGEARLFGLAQVINLRQLGRRKEIATTFRMETSRDDNILWCGYPFPTCHGEQTEGTRGHLLSRKPGSYVGIAAASKKPMPRDDKNEARYLNNVFRILSNDRL